MYGNKLMPVGLLENLFLYYEWCVVCNMIYTKMIGETNEKDNITD